MPILSFRCMATRRFFSGAKVKRLERMGTVAMRKLAMLNAADSLADLRIPPANRLEALRGDRAGQWSIRINDQFRVCFTWTDAGACNVEICDYH
ncbi:proteic killer suppression protein [Stenotrophomonas rhizophila]|uniref:Proteic killer suppression protein n=2 Tax=Stenotrophomonas rhizophila TaxID=216778 RepID=A0AAW5PJ47_9GAMM|nr:proteic killer suppression protein [Stenotrophomonas rhizophila]